LFCNLFKVRGREPKENYFRGGVMEKRLRTTGLILSTHPGKK